MAKPKIVNIAEQRGQSVEQLLQEMFKEFGSQTAVAHALGVDQSTISLWLMRAGLRTKTVLVPRQQVAHE